MTRCVAFDLAHLFIGMEKRTPRGIDRVDLAFANHFLENFHGDCVAVLPTPWGMRWFDRERAIRTVRYITDHWGEGGEGDRGEGLDWTKRRLRGGRPERPAARARKLPARLLHGFGKFAIKQGLALGKPVRSLPKASIYLNTGQVTLGFRQFFHWLVDRGDIAPVFMLHDVIPIDYPEYCSPFATRLHRRAVETTARHAERLIVTTEAAGDSIRRELEALGRSDLPTMACPLPVAPSFLEPAAQDPDLSGITYFVAVGSQAPHKNHLMLLNVWRELVRLEGADAPKLVLAGSRDRTNPALTTMLESCTAIRDHVIEIAGLPTPALRQLMAGARAVLMPSFTEGFGLPIVEALALGVPVIASDLGCHRESGGSGPAYLDPTDGLGWLSAIRAHARSAPVRPAAPKHASWTQDDYFSRIEPFVTGD